MENLVLIGVPILKHITVVEFENIVDPDEAAYNEPPQGLHSCL